MLIELHIIYINMHYVHIHALYLFCSPISINQNCSTFIWTVIQRNQWICWSLILTLCLVNLKYQSNEQTPNALTDWNQSHFPKLAASLYFWIPPPNTNSHALFIVSVLHKQSNHILFVPKFQRPTRALLFKRRAASTPKCLMKDNDLNIWFLRRSHIWKWLLMERRIQLTKAHSQLFPIQEEFCCSGCSPNPTLWSRQCVPTAKHFQMWPWSFMAWIIVIPTHVRARGPEQGGKSASIHSCSSYVTEISSSHRLNL